MVWRKSHRARSDRDGHPRRARTGREPWCEVVTTTFFEFIEKSRRPVLGIHFPTVEVRGHQPTARLRIARSCGIDQRLAITAENAFPANPGGTCRDPGQRPEGCRPVAGAVRTSAKAQHGPFPDGNAPLERAIGAESIGQINDRFRLDACAAGSCPRVAGPLRKPRAMHIIGAPIVGHLIRIIDGWSDGGECIDRHVFIEVDIKQLPPLGPLRGDRKFFFEYRWSFDLGLPKRRDAALSPRA